MLEREVQLALHLVEDIACYADPARFAQPLQTRRYVHAVAVNVVTFDDDVADVDATAVDNLPIFRDPIVALPHGGLHLNGEGDRIHDAAKLHECAVAHKLDDAPVILRQFGFD